MHEVFITLPLVFRIMEWQPFKLCDERMSKIFAAFLQYGQAIRRSNCIPPRIEYICVKTISGTFSNGNYNTRRKGNIA